MVPQLIENGGLVSTRSKRISSPPSTCCGSARVSSLRRSAVLMPCSSMFILAMDQTVPLASCPNRLALRAVAAVLVDVLLGRDQHAARAAAGVVDARAAARA